MSVKLQIQSTPNPNALKFVLNVPVKTEGKVTYKTAAECSHNPLAQALLGVEHIHEVYFFDNYITVTQNGNGDWDALEEKIKAIILEKIEQHDPNFKVEESAKPVVISDNPDIEKINAILDQTIRPALQMDGGDIQVIQFEGNTIKVNYQGACGSCPSSAMGTLKAIENILRDEFKPDVVV
ncbi:MAG: hypothetical protein A2787_00050, partial [Omnitrophica WOR_2 bacterium RIFCSPHIGHO2_01_FULL_48_9]